MLKSSVESVAQQPVIDAVIKLWYNRSMDTIRNYQLKSISYLPQHQKLWGWFVLQDGSSYRNRWCWCWWAQAGKTISIKRHVHSYHAMTMLENRKKKNGYSVVSESELLEIWPDFRECLDRSMLFEMLTHDAQAWSHHRDSGCVAAHRFDISS
jgi:hypothetical protein